MEIRQTKKAENCINSSVWHVWISFNLKIYEENNTANCRKKFHFRIPKSKFQRVKYILWKNQYITECIGIAVSSNSTLIECSKYFACRRWIEVIFGLYLHLLNAICFPSARRKFNNLFDRIVFELTCSKRWKISLKYRIYVK